MVLSEVGKNKEGCITCLLGLVTGTHLRLLKNAGVCKDCKPDEFNVGPFKFAKSLLFNNSRGRYLRVYVVFCKQLLFQKLFFACEVGDKVRFYVTDRWTSNGNLNLSGGTMKV